MLTWIVLRDVKGVQRLRCLSNTAMKAGTTRVKIIDLMINLFQVVLRYTSGEKETLFKADGKISEEDLMNF